jgi:hypothetical protein
MKIANCCFSCIAARDAGVENNPAILQCALLAGVADKYLVHAYNICENFKRTPRL